MKEESKDLQTLLGMAQRALEAQREAHAAVMRREAITGDPRAVARADYLAKINAEAMAALGGRHYA